MNPQGNASIRAELLHAMLGEQIDSEDVYVDAPAHYVIDSILALIRRREAEAVGAFAERVKERLHGLPRHRPTNASLWDGVQMEAAIAEVDAELQRLQGEGE